MIPNHRIKRLRLKKGMTQEELAAKTGFSVRTIQRIETGGVAPRAYTLQIIAVALDVEFALLNNVEAENSEVKYALESKTWLIALHVSGLFILLIPPLLIWVWKKDKIKDLREHDIDVINFQLSMWIILIPSATLALIPIPIFLGVFSSVLILINMIKVINNQPYRYPLSFKFLN